MLGPNDSNSDVVKWSSDRQHAKHSDPERPTTLAIVESDALVRVVNEF